jgi:hypothetical protein
MNNVRYVGITKREPLNRFVEHLSSRTERAALRYYPIKGTQGLSRKGSEGQVFDPFLQ